MIRTSISTSIHLRQPPEGTCALSGKQSFTMPLAAVRRQTAAHACLVGFQHFIRQYNQKTGKKITGLSAQALSKLQTYHWPGNIRELEHLIERSVLLTKGTLIENIGLLNMGQPTITTTSEDQRIKTIDENERDHIIAVLRKCNGRIWGAGGAAEVLNVPPTTLNSKMKKLDIKKEYMDHS